MAPMIQTTRKMAALSLGVISVSLCLGAGCEPRRAQDLSRLDEMQTVDLDIKGHAFRCWVADNDDTREAGLMNVAPDLMADLPDGTHRGMLFVFPSDNPAHHGFWMKNTVIPLDIAFIRANGVIVTIRTMAPHDLRHTSATAPYRYALEVNANLFSDLDINEGDTIELPNSVLTPQD